MLSFSRVCSALFVSFCEQAMISAAAEVVCLAYITHDHKTMA